MEISRFPNSVGMVFALTHRMEELIAQKDKASMDLLLLHPYILQFNKLTQYAAYEVAS